MKTRTLLLLALACGIAILMSGVALFWRISHTTTTKPAPLGQPVAVGDMDVTVAGAREAGETYTVDLTLGGIDDDDPTTGFRLIASGREVRVDSTTCGPSTREPAPCSLTFEMGAVDGASRVLLYRRGEQQARWQLS